MLRNLDFPLPASEVTLKGGDAPVYPPQIKRPAIEVAEHERLVIPPKKRAFDIFPKFEETVDNPCGVGPAIDVIPNEQEMIVVGGVNLIEKSVE
jgi:hypothetical protein